MKRFVFFLLFSLSITVVFGKVRHLTKQEFLDRVWNYEVDASTWKFKGNRPCLIEFYASWCGPCKVMAPMLEELSVFYNGKIDIYKINTEVEYELSAAWGIQSIPTFLFCPLTNAPRMSMGAMNKESMKKAIDEVLLK